MTNVRAWLRLVRAPNLGTAVADVIAGGALAGAALASPAVLIPAAGSAALYAGGVALNDVFDLRKDRVLHPGRVLPSGTLSRGAALGGGFALLAVGVWSGAAQGPMGLWIAAAIAGAIVLYDILPDAAAWPSAIVLGVCRGLNLARGAFAVEEPAAVIPYACNHFVLVALITLVSLGEDQRVGTRTVRVAAWLLPAAYVATATVAPRGALALVVFFLMCLLACWVAPTRGNPTAAVPRAVFSITLVDALYCMASRAWVAAAALIVLFAASRAAARLLAQRGS